MPLCNRLKRILYNPQQSLTLSLTSLLTAEDLTCACYLSSREIVQLMPRTACIFPTSSKPIVWPTRRFNFPTFSVIL